MFYPIIDRIISEFDRRFESIQCDIMKGIEALNPQADKFLDLQFIEKFATVYSSDIEDCKHEIHQIKGLLRRTKEDKKPSLLLTLLTFLQPYKETFHELDRLCKIAISLPVSTAACERSFSALRQIKTYVRSSMIDIQLSNVSVLTTEKERAIALPTKDIVNAFAMDHKNRRIALI